ncbi:G-type lectin S-receptor-like serine/threonine-protein kinase At1g34300 [Musa acuminata AAA Group]|uniref:G-type lectin S-receptor-like serine/threonine-protein kinase At1g34300 n=1 Tax=Musa acuminata AAA Group TaxID=214697 RepID=UPI0031D84C12
MVLLEIVSGQRNFDVSDDTGRKKFSVCGYEELEKGNIKRPCAGTKCIQEQPSLRPSMRKVVQMLEGVLAIDRPPAPKAADGGLAAVTSSSANTSITVFATSSPLQPSSGSSYSIENSSLVSKRNLVIPGRPRPIFLAQCYRDASCSI